MDSNKETRRNQQGNTQKFSSKLSRKIIRYALIAAFLAITFVLAQVSKPLDTEKSDGGGNSTVKSTSQTGKSESQESSGKSGFGFDFDSAPSSPFGDWLIDTFSGRNTDQLKPWDMFFYKRKEEPNASASDDSEFEQQTSYSYSSGSYDLGSFEYTGEPYSVLNDNEPTFSSDEYTTTAFEQYSDLDKLGRCGQAYACIGPELMPKEERESISTVKPSGWHNQQYDSSIVEGSWLYNRCHLIAFCLSGENQNERNLITGTRYFNVQGMLPFEMEVADYINETGNHVLYRVTPVYDGDNLVASGVEMEAKSMEDDSVHFNVFVFNVQPGVAIDYATGENHAE